MNNTNRLSDAIIYATRAHKNQFDLNGEPYIFHPLRVMLQMKTESARIVAVLHDLLEDTKYPVPAFLNEKEYDALIALTRSKEEVYTNYVNRVCKNETAVFVKIADIADNSLPERCPSPNHKNMIETRYKRALKELNEAREYYIIKHGPTSS